MSGRPWTKMAAWCVREADHYDRPSTQTIRFFWLRQALEIIRDHSRKAETRDEARRLRQLVSDRLRPSDFAKDALFHV